MSHSTEDPRVTAGIAVARASILNWFRLRPTLPLDASMLWGAEVAARAAIWARYAKTDEALRAVRLVTKFVAVRKEQILTGADAASALAAGDMSYWDADDFLGPMSSRSYGWCPPIPAGWWDAVQVEVSRAAA